jgi:hypothetical protein
MRRAGLSRIDVAAAVVAAVSFVGGFVVGFAGTAEILLWLFGFVSGDKLGEAVIGVLIAFPAGCVGAWGGSYLCVRAFGNRTHLGRVPETWRVFGFLVWAAFGFVAAVGTITSRAFVTVPALVLGLALAYLASRLLVLNRPVKSVAS